VPRLHFLHDASVERGFEIDKLIRQAVGSGAGNVAGHDAAAARSEAGEPAVPDDAVPDDATRDVHDR
jgi:hypothetical protein